MGLVLGYLISMCSDELIAPPPPLFFFLLRGIFRDESREWVRYGLFWRQEPQPCSAGVEEERSVTWLPVAAVWEGRKN